MDFRLIKIVSIKKSPTNNRPEAYFKSAKFNDLVASVKEKGVLSPILVRPVGKGFELVFGECRLRATEVAGLKEIPSAVREMSDTEAREVQIIENLQREDLHPLEEGASYRDLVENSKPKYTIEDVAAKVGKSASYVRQRLGLTNLSKEVAKAFREGEITPAQAVVIARLDDDKRQKEALEKCEYKDANELREWVHQTSFKDFSNRPWKDDAELAALVGDKGSKPSLFSKAGEDADPIDYAKQMAAYIEIMIRKAKAKGETLEKVAETYGTPAVGGALNRNQYIPLENKKEQKAAKDARKAIVVEAYNDASIGRIIWISTILKKETSGRSNYRQTKEEKAADDKRKEAEKKKNQLEDKKLSAVIDSIALPLQSNVLDVLFDLAISSACTEDEVAQRLGLVTEEDKYDAAAKALKKHFATLDEAGKMRIIIEILVRYEFGSSRTAIVKRLEK